MLEVLVTIVILVFGMLGLAGLQAKIQVSETESYQRSHAILLLQDFANRISANRANAAAYITAAPLGTGDDEPASCSALTGTALDRCEWSNALKGSAETQGGTSVGAMVGARGCVEQIGVNPTILQVTIAWQGMSPLSAPSVSCGQDLYGEDSYRRAIVQSVSIGNLSGI